MFQVKTNFRTGETGKGTVHLHGLKAGWLSQLSPTALAGVTKPTGGTSNSLSLNFIRAIP